MEAVGEQTASDVMLPMMREAVAQKLRLFQQRRLVSDFYDLSVSDASQATR